MKASYKSVTRKKPPLRVTNAPMITREKKGPVSPTHKMPPAGNPRQPQTPAVPMAAPGPQECQMEGNNGY